MKSTRIALIELLEEIKKSHPELTHKQIIKSCMKIWEFDSWEEEDVISKLKEKYVDNKI
jgi:hypothetical protein